jgi:hypothetical protein
MPKEGIICIAGNDPSSDLLERIMNETITNPAVKIVRGSPETPHDLLLFADSLEEYANRFLASVIHNTSLPKMQATFPFRNIDRHELRRLGKHFDISIDVTDTIGLIHMLEETTPGMRHAAVRGIQELYGCLEASKK